MSGALIIKRSTAAVVVKSGSMGIFSVRRTQGRALIIKRGGIPGATGGRGAAGAGIDNFTTDLAALYILSKN